MILQIDLTLERIGDAVLSKCKRSRNPPLTHEERLTLLLRHQLDKHEDILMFLAEH